MKKIKKTVLLTLLMLLSAVFCLCIGSQFATAETVQKDGSEYSSGQEEIAPRGLYTDLQFALNGENGQVWASVKNKFTLFPSTVTVNIELYRSDTYQDNYNNMTLVATNYIYDLDQGETLTASASTNSKQSYWKARAYYKIDKKDIREYLSDTLLFNADGIRVLEN